MEIWSTVKYLIASTATTESHLPMMNCEFYVMRSSFRTQYYRLMFFLHKVKFYVLQQSVNGLTSLNGESNEQMEFCS